MFRPKSWTVRVNFEKHPIGTMHNVLEDSLLPDVAAEIEACLSGVKDKLKQGFGRGHLVVDSDGVCLKRLGITREAEIAIRAAVIVAEAAYQQLLREEKLAA